MKSAEEVLGDLAQRSNVSLHSDSGLVGAVATAAAEDDEERAKKQAEEKGTKDEDGVLRRKPELQPIPVRGDGSVQLTSWDVLHVLGRAIALSRRGAARGLAEHWGALKYSQALTGDTGSFMKLSAEGKVTADYYKVIQSSELGVGFALALARRVLAQRHPDRVVSIVPADTALRAGWALTSREKGPRQNYRYRPQFFAELWRPGAPSLVLPIACKGNHSNAAYSHGQLASASAHVEAVHIGPWNETPALVFSTELPLEGHVAVHALCAGGSGGWLGRDHAKGGGLDVKLRDENHFPQIQLPANGDEAPVSVPGFHVTRERYEWFGQVLARTAAAGLTAFAGNGLEATAQYLTERQGRKHFTGFAHAATGSVQDADHTLLGIRFIGTDHVFRLNGTRVEAFSGVAKDLLHLLAEGRVEQSRREIYERRSAWPSKSWDDLWDGPVSVHPDGTVLAMRLLP
ncbi:hypothetical protein SACE_2299 [Saccharopolyspora erythraea NRRL 2338]|uniref:Uncharacterized protein n=1 Tax=Saccharopolyspora erythraea (strain ATCC 11635 / DSM 40517 / JCM 4748 / NBRC 13426 / NCIMB 8594 / NRRL 2338) TaxID=405948 RepID=A4FC26_SACEN|nr:hypothetical protein SACE_2299 [Saccharopolyspora erythraea NRRL 2338]